MEREAFPKVAHEVVFYSEHFEIRGLLESRPPRRLLDLLNDRMRSVLTLSEASLRPIAEPEARPLLIPSLAVNKEALTLAWLIKETRVEGGEFITIHEVAHPVVVYVGPFVVTGRLHTIQEATLAQALDAMLEDFVAITQPSVLCMTNRALSLKEGVIAAVRKGKIVALHERLSSA